MGIETLPEGRIERITAVSHHVAEIVNQTLPSQRPYVGTSAFAHKAGLHTSAIARARDAYEHLDTNLVGNGTRFVVSEMAGRATLQLKAEELGLDLDGASMTKVLDSLKQLEYEGYHFEVADGSLELLLRGSTGWEQPYFRIESFRVISEHKDDGSFPTEATVKVWLPPLEAGGSDQREVATGEGNGPVNALDAAFRRAVGQRYPHLAELHHSDYKVRVLDTSKGTAARTRVLIDSSDGEQTWTTIGVSENVIEASWQALSDSIVYGLVRGERAEQAQQA
jgi:2-isopropylmalate synthase